MNDTVLSRGEKMLADMSVKMSPEMRRQVKLIAEIDDITDSEYVRRLIEADLNIRNRQYLMLHSIFGESNGEHQVDPGGTRSDLVPPG